MGSLAKRQNHFVSTLLWMIFLVAIWEFTAWILHSVVHINSAETKWPYFHDLVINIFQNIPVLFEQGSITFGKAAQGFIIGTLAGMLLALIMSFSKSVKYTLSPYIISSQMIPVIGLAPIIFGILRDPDLSRIVTAGYITFFPVTINMLQGLENIKPQQLELMRSYATPSWKMYTKFKIIAALPNLFSGMKIAAPLAVTASVVVELMGAPNGIGVLMLSSLYYGEAQAHMFWSVILICVFIGIASFIFILLLERIITSWQPEFHRERNET
ncbi:ABC transporter permease [Aquibacillus albus]|uniref:NitT/TauT family transport system permease protein n=1 Tax=Aquibacillus albus TaxID=1168171 RepID=A0ABS2N3I0_9BACI|nr:ABC transporter permease subunit [Aquibacillus albus]MBM7572694.1 NitT/TauT family transport system permease protein [Aquibacillus albus]